MRPSRRRLELVLPALRTSRYSIAGEAMGIYNCIAWAAGEDSRWWAPFDQQDHWPAGVPRDDGLASVMAALATVGYEPCDDGVLEEGMEKIAFYAIDVRFTHVAVQLADGRWSSKLGPDERIEHDELDALASHANSGGSWQYGEVAAFMARPWGRGGFA